MHRYTFNINYDVKVLARTEKEAREIIHNTIELPDEDVEEGEGISGIVDEDFTFDSFSVSLDKTEEVVDLENDEEEEEEKE